MQERLRDRKPRGGRFTGSAWPPRALASALLQGDRPHTGRPKPCDARSVRGAVARDADIQLGGAPSGCGERRFRTCATRGSPAGSSSAAGIVTIGALESTSTTVPAESNIEGAGPALQRRAFVVAPASALRSASVRGCSYCRDFLQLPAVRCMSRCTDRHQAGAKVVAQALFAARFGSAWSRGRCPAREEVLPRVRALVCGAGDPDQRHGTGSRAVNAGAA